MQQHRRARFFFDSRFAAEPECELEVKEGWLPLVQGRLQYKVKDKIRKCKSRLQRWKKGRNFNLSLKIHSLEERLADIHRGTGFDLNEERRWLLALRAAWGEEEVWWQQKSRVQWLREGDKNTSFFHAFTRKRRQQHRVSGLFDSADNWVEEPMQLESIVAEDFENIYRTSGPTDFFFRQSLHATELPYAVTHSP